MLENAKEILKVDPEAGDESNEGTVDNLIINLHKEKLEIANEKKSQKEKKKGEQKAFLSYEKIAGLKTNEAKNGSSSSATSSSASSSSKNSVSASSTLQPPSKVEEAIAKIVDSKIDKSNNTSAKETNKHELSMKRAQNRHERKLAELEFEKEKAKRQEEREKKQQELDEKKAAKDEKQFDLLVSLLAAKKDGER